MGRPSNPDLRVGVVDGYPVARAGLRAFLGSAPHIRLLVDLPGGLAGKYLTATSTDMAGNTSEFSKAIEIRTGKAGKN